MAQVKRIKGARLWILILLQMAVIMGGYEFIKTAVAHHPTQAAEWGICGAFTIGIAVIIAIMVGRLQKRREQGEIGREDLIARLEDSLAQIKTLSTLLPVCAGCKRIQDDEGQWQQMETYISSHSEAKFSHGMCDECTQRMYPDMWEEIKARRQDRS